MQEIDIETIVQRGREKYPDARPRVITDNGPQFISRDFKEFIFCLSGEQTFRNVWGELWFDLSGNATEGIKFCFRRGNQRERTRRGRNRVRLPVSGHPPHTTTACGFLTHLRCFPILITAFIFSPTATITRVSGDSPSSRFPEPGWICHVESIFLGSSELSAARADLRQATGERR
jgi:hypothetical protein